MKNIFVIGMDDFGLDMVKTVRGSEGYRFHGLLDYDQVVNPAHYPIEEMIAAGKAQLDRFEGPVDAIIGHWDFPTTALMTIFREHCGLNVGPSLASVLIAEHKYWARLRERTTIPEHAPAFEAVNPFADDAAERIGLDYPYWLKPVIAFSSQLAFKICNREDLDEALAQQRASIGRFGEPFKAFLDMVELPGDIPRAVDGYHAIAEAAISGELCTAEGYIRRGRPTVYGIVDSYREGKHGSSFSRYQLPSRVPAWVRERIVEYSDRVVPRLGLDDTPFNIEYFWDMDSDRIWLLEVNPRISRSHSPLFADITGASHHEVALDVALDTEPDFPRSGGCCAVAGKFMLRRHHDGRVTRAPSEQDLHELEASYPGTRIEVVVEEGQRLSELRGQDAYSYEVAVVFMGADDTQALLKQYEDLKAQLSLEFEDVATGAS